MNEKHREETQAAAVKAAVKKALDEGVDWVAKGAVTPAKECARRPDVFLIRARSTLRTSTLAARTTYTY